MFYRFGVMNKLILPEAEDEGNILIPPRTDILSASNIDIEIRYGNVPQTGKLVVYVVGLCV